MSSREYDRVGIAVAPGEVNSVFSSSGPLMDICRIRAIGVVRAPLAEIAALRRHPGPAWGTPPPASLLRYSDEQTVLAVAAMRHALQSFSQDDCLNGWGVVAAPRWLGRLGATSQLDRFMAEGPRSVSPMTVPNLSLHAVAATLSLAFKLRGPTFGVGGGLESPAEGLLTGLSVQLEERPPGTWVVLTAWEPEPTVDAHADSIGHAIVLGLVPDDGEEGLRLIYDPAGDGASATMPKLAAFLAGEAGNRWTCGVVGGGGLTLDTRRAAA